MTQEMDSAKMMRTLTIIATLSGLLVVLVVELTKPIIAENQRVAVEKAIFQVIPGAVQWREYRLLDGKLESEKSSNTGVAIYAGFDAEGELSGIAAEAASQGYADTIKLLFGYNPGCECITGIKILKSAETPGLGDKIFKDQNFVANFDALDATLNSDSSALANSIVTVKHGKKSEPWQIDSISGATVSSRAIGKALNEAAQFLLPVLAGQWSEFEVAEATE